MYVVIKYEVSFMSKIKTIAFLFTLGIAGSASAVEPGTVIDTGSTAISQNVTSASCSVSFPGNITLPPFSTATFNNTSQYGPITDKVDVGNITFNGCNNSTVSVVVTSSNRTSPSGYLYPRLKGEDQSAVGYWLKINNYPGKPNGRTPELQSILIDSDSYALPVTIEAVKLLNTTFDARRVGELTANITYTATYS